MSPFRPSPHRVSLAEAAADAGRFLAREHRLVLPLALLFGMLPPLAFELLLPDFQLASPDMTRLDPRIGWMAPVALAGLIGGMAITALRLHPGISVAESLGLAMRRLPALIGAWLVAMAGMTVMLLVLLVGASFIGLLAGVRTEALTRLGSTFSFLLLLTAFARLLPLVPVVMAEGPGPVAALRRTLLLTRGRFWRLAGACVLMLLTVPLASLAARATIGSVGRLLDLATGAEGLFAAAAAVLVNAIGAGVSAYLYLAIAALYRRLS